MGTISFNEMIESVTAPSQEDKERSEFAHMIIQNIKSNQLRICTKCGTPHEDVQFFSFKDGSKDAECKWCRSAIDFGNEEKIREFCRVFDVPFLKEEWDRTLEKAKNKYNGAYIKKTVCGRYLSLMKLKSYNNFTYEDSDELNERRRIKMSQEYDVVNKPKHYNREGGFESIEEMEMIFGIEATMNFCLLNVWKYRYRAADKNGEEDLRKSDWYMRKYKELKEKKNNPIISGGYISTTPANVKTTPLTMPSWTINTPGQWTINTPTTAENTIATYKTEIQNC